MHIDEIILQALDPVPIEFTITMEVIRDGLKATITTVFEDEDLNIIAN